MVKVLGVSWEKNWHMLFNKVTSQGLQCPRQHLTQLKMDVVCYDLAITGKKTRYENKTIANNARVGLHEGEQIASGLNS